MKADYGKAARFLHLYGRTGQHNLLLALDDYYPTPEIVDHGDHVNYQFSDWSTLTVEKRPAFLTRQAD